MWQSSLFALAVILCLAGTCAGIYFSGKQGRFQTWCYRMLLGVYAGGVIYFTLLSRSMAATPKLLFRPFYIYRVGIGCWLGLKTVTRRLCLDVFRSSPNIFHVTTDSPVEDCILNIVLFIPFGFLLPFIWKKATWWRVLLVGLLVSIAIESLQYAFHLGCCDVDDLIHNSAGTLLGLGLRTLLLKIFSWIKK